MSDLVLFTRDGPVGVITINNPPVNALSPGVPEGIQEAIRGNQDDDAIDAFVLIGGGRTFIAGADIKEFGKITSGQKERGHGLHPLLGVLEGCPKPVVAAIHGTAFGGGLEVAQACHYRLAIASAKIGQPEVKLGIIPGAAGTQRLPRLAGVAKAAEMCALGDPVAVNVKDGIIDHIVEGKTQGDLLAGAVAFARQVGAKPGPPPRARERSDRLGDEAANAPIFAAMRETVRKKRRGMMAPLKAIEAVEAATKLPFDEGVKREAELFRECLYSDQSKALIHAFFGEREVRKIPGIPKDAPIFEINKAGIVGAGTMGGGIAMAYLNAGIPVILREATQEALDRGLATIRKNYERSVKRGRFTSEYVEQRLAMLQPRLSFDGFEEVDIVVEAIFENMQPKKDVFAELDRIAKPGAILASNTSTLNIDEIAAVTSRPEQVIGHHFFSPANVMRLLEIVRGKATSDKVIASSMALAKRLRKVGVLVGNCFGFVGNSMFHAYGREAQFLAEEGATIAAIDEALYDFGMAMGPLATGDLAGLDVGWRIRKENPQAYPEGARRPLLSDRLCELGRYGQKTGAGYYRYGDNRQRLDDPEVAKMVREIAAEAGISRREISREEIIERTIYALVNVGAKRLEEGMALRPVDIDIIYLNGYGFPAYRGGPMWHADTIGLDKVYSRVSEFHDQHGPWWEPSPLLERLASEGKTFSQWAAERAAAA